MARRESPVTRISDLPEATGGVGVIDAPKPGGAKRRPTKAEMRSQRNANIVAALTRTIEQEQSFYKESDPHWEQKEQAKLATDGGFKAAQDKLNGMVAAVTIMNPNEPAGNSTAAPNAVTRTWQHAAWGYVHCVPELHAAQMYVGNALARCDLVVGKTEPDGSVVQGYDGDEPVEGLDNGVAGEASELINKLRGPSGGKSELLRAFGEKTFVIGESYLIPEDTPKGTVFEVLSTQELMRSGNGFIRYYGPGWAPEPLPPDTQPIRVWRPDAQYSKMADSSVRSCLEILEELVVLTRLVRAAAISRMALSGILLLPDELDTPDDDEAEDGGQAESMNTLATDIINIGAKSIDDPASAASWMPFLLQGPSEFLKDVRHVPFQTSDELQMVQRTEAIQRLARGLDLPPEVVLGHADTTFSNAVQVSEDTFKLHLEPALQLICDALTVGYLWPAMAKSRGIQPEDLEDAPYPDDILMVAITFDARKLISRPDRTKEMIDLYIHDTTQSSVRISEVREALGLDPENGPDDTEIAKRVDAIRLTKIREVIQASPADAAVPIAQATAGKAPIPGKSEGHEIIENGKPQAGKAAAAPAAGAVDPVTGQPVNPATKQALEDAVTGSAKAIGAAEMTIHRAVEKVGAKLRTKAKGDMDAALVAGVTNDRVASVLGLQRSIELLPAHEIQAIIGAEVAMLARSARVWVGAVKADAVTQATMAACSRALYADHDALSFEMQLIALTG